MEDLPRMEAPETARRLTCDASVIAIIENEKGEPLSVGRKTRSIPPAIQRALNSRDKGCHFPEKQLAGGSTTCAQAMHLRLNSNRPSIRVSASAISAFA